MARFLVQNAGDAIWTAFIHIADPAIAVAVGVSVDGVLTGKTPLRQNICPGQRSPVVVEFETPSAPGTRSIGFHFMPLDSTALDARATPFFDIAVQI